ncbi:MAG: glycosyltransferase family 4 protein [Janthinobacterium lividum]
MQALPPASRQAGPLRLGAYGRYTAQKGFDLLIAAMRLVPPHVASLDLAGYGEDAAALHRAAAHLPHVRVHGPCDGPARFLAGIDCVVVPSRWEAFGLVALEARAAGRPVIATAVDGLVEQMALSWGELVPPNDPVALAAAIHRMAARDLAPMAAAARRSAEGRQERKVTAWRDLLLTLTSRGPDRPGRLAEMRIGRGTGVAECEPARLAECESRRC